MLCGEEDIYPLVDGVTCDYVKNKTWLLLGNTVYTILRLLDEAMRGLSRDCAWTPASNVWEDEKGFLTSPTAKARPVRAGLTTFTAPAA